jgi:hypothetical protein
LGNGRDESGERGARTYLIAARHQSGATGSTVIVGEGPGAPSPLWLDQLMHFRNG